MVVNFSLIRKMSAPILNCRRILQVFPRLLPLTVTLCRSCQSICKPCLFSSRSSSVQASEVKKQFSWLEDHAPVFGISGDQVSILNDPTSYYNTLKTLAKKCRKRLVLASLYLGTGGLEEALVCAIKEALEHSPDLEVTILLDCTRGSRGQHNSRTMLLPLLQLFPGRVNVSLYHTPDLRGFLKTLIPERYNEVVSVQHLKVYIFDDTFVTSGANLSDSYFVNRQDRYIRIDGCCELATFYECLVKAICSFSFRLHANNTLSIDQSFGIHPFKGNKKEFQEAAKGRIMSVISPNGKSATKEQYEKESRKSSKVNHDQMKQRTFVDEAVSNSSGDTLLKGDHMSAINRTLPVLQVVTDIEEKNSNKFMKTSDSFTSNGISNNGSANSIDFDSKLLKQENIGSHISLSERTEQVLSGESSDNEDECKNFSDKKVQRTSESDPVIDTWVYPLVQMGPLDIRVDQTVTAGLLERVQEASKLFLASGYFNLTQQYKEIILRSKGQCEILLASPQVNGFYGASGVSGFIPDSYTYIARKFYESVCRRNLKNKIHMHEYYRDDWTFHAKGLWYYLPGQTLPSLTLIGSPNFGHRSVSRDLESQLAVVTTNLKLQKQLHKEQEMLYSWAETVDEGTYKKSNRKVPSWVKVVTIIAHNFY